MSDFDVNCNFSLDIRLMFLIPMCYRAISNCYPLDFTSSTGLSSLGLDLSVTNGIYDLTVSWHLCAQQHAMKFTHCSY